MARDSRAHWLRTGYRSFRVEEDGSDEAVSGRSSDTIRDIKEDVLASDDERPVRVYRQPPTRGAGKYNQAMIYVATYKLEDGKVRRYKEEEQR